VEFSALRNLLAKEERIGAVCFNPDGKYLATGAWDGAILASPSSSQSPRMFIFLQVWEINTKYVRNAFKGHTRHIFSLNFSPNGRLLVSTSDDNTIRLWNMHDGATKLLTEENPTVLDDPCYPSAGFSPNGRYVAACHRDGMVRIWDVCSGQLIMKMKAHTDWATCVVFTPDGKGSVSGGSDYRLKYWDVSSLDSTRCGSRSQTTCRNDPGAEEPTRIEREFIVHGVRWLHRLSYESGTPFALQALVHSLAISPDGRWVASSSSDRTVRIWDTRNAATQCTLDHDDQIWTVDFSPAGCHLASGGEDGTLRIWKYSSVAFAQSCVRGGQ
jgi:WD40 repeat protein